MPAPHNLPSTRELIALSTTHRLLGNFRDAHSLLCSLPQSNRAAALASSEIYIDQRDYRSAVQVLEAAAPPQDERNLEDLEAVFLRLQAMAVRRVSMENKLDEADDYLEQVVHRLKLLSNAKREDASSGEIISAEAKGSLKDTCDIQKFDALYRTSAWSSDSVQDFVPQIEFLYWSIHLMSIASRHKADTNWERLYPGLLRLREIEQLFSKDGRIYHAAAVAENYCHILTAAPTVKDEVLIREIQSITDMLPDCKDDRSALLAVWANIHITVANVYHQYVCRRGGDLMSEQRDRECGIAADQFGLCHHSFGDITVSFLRRYEYGLHTDLEELSKMAEKYESLQNYGGQLQVLGFRADIAVTLRDYPTYDETVRDIKSVMEKTGAFFSSSRYTFEPDTAALSGDRGKILEGGEAALADLLKKATPTTGAEASLCEILANASIEDPMIRCRYLERMLEASARDGQPFLASYAAGELAQVEISLLDSIPAARLDAAVHKLEQFLVDWAQKDAGQGNWDSQCKKYALLSRLSFRFQRSAITSKTRIDECLDCIEKFDQDQTRHQDTVIFVVESMVLPWLQPSGSDFPSDANFMQACKAWKWALDWVGETSFRGNASLGLASALIQWHRSYPQNQVSRLTAALNQINVAKRVCENWENLGIQWRAHMLAAILWQARIDMTGNPRDAASNAISELEAAESLFCVIRNDLSALGGLRALEQKQNFVAESSHQVIKLAINICHSHLSAAPNVLWRWIQHGKARSLSDLLGQSVSIPIHLLEDIGEPARQYLDRKRHLSQEIQMAKPERRFTKRKELEDLHRTMEKLPELREIIDFWEGRALTIEDVSQISPNPEQPVVCVDWVEIGNKFAMTTVRTGAEPTLHSTDITTEQVEIWIDQHLNIIDLSSRKAAKWMQELAPLVKPLIACSEPNELLIFSPTGLLHALPLHALEIEKGTPVLERNPVVYSANLAILRCCTIRRQQQSLPASPTAAVFGNPSNDREGGTESTAYIGQLFDKEPRVTDSATKDRFLQESQDVDIIHFHGHAHTKRRSPLHVSPDEATFVSRLLSSEYPPSMAKDATPLDDSIEFANKAYLEAREIFNLKLQGHITLIACGSGEQTIGIGDEPSGLITALLVAGASSVLGTLWPIADDEGRDFSKLFYEQLLAGRRDDAVINLAEALRSAALSMRDRETGSQPFQWASFVLHGAWYWKRQRSNDEGNATTQ